MPVQVTSAPTQLRHLAESWQPCHSLDVGGTALQLQEAPWHLKLRPCTGHGDLPTSRPPGVQGKGPWLMGGKDNRAETGGDAPALHTGADSSQGGLPLPPSAHTYLPLGAVTTSTLR